MMRYEVVIFKEVMAHLGLAFSHLFISLNTPRLYKACCPMALIIFCVFDISPYLWAQELTITRASWYVRVVQNSSTNCNTLGISGRFDGVGDGTVGDDDNFTFSQISADGKTEFSMTGKVGRYPDGRIKEIESVEATTAIRDNRDGRRIWNMQGKNIPLTDTDQNVMRFNITGKEVCDYLTFYEYKDSIYCPEGNSSYSCTSDYRRSVIEINLVGQALRPNLAKGEVWEPVNLAGTFTPGKDYKVEFIRYEGDERLSVEAPILNVASDHIRARIPVGILGTEESFLARTSPGFEEIVDVDISSDDVMVVQGKATVIHPRPLIYDEAWVRSVTPPAVSTQQLGGAAGQQFLRQFSSANLLPNMAFWFVGRTEDGFVSFRALNTASSGTYELPLNLNVTVLRVLGGDSPIGSPLPNMNPYNAGVRFRIEQDDIYVIVVGETDSGGPLPAPFQVHLAGDAGLPIKRIINKIGEEEIEIPRATRMDTLFNHPAPRPQTLVNLGEPLEVARAAPTTVFKFANLVSSRRVPVAVLRPPAEGFALGTSPFRAPDPVNILNITTPTATSPGVDGLVAGEVLDFTQVPLPQIPFEDGADRPPVQETIGALMAPLWSFTLTNSVILDMGAGHEIVNRPGPDFRVEATSGSYALAVGNTPYNGSLRELPGVITGQQAFDLATTGLRSVRYIRVTPSPQVTLKTVKSLHAVADQIIAHVGPVMKVSQASFLMRRGKAPGSTLDPFLEFFLTDGSYAAEAESGYGETLSLDRSDAVLPKVDLGDDRFYRVLARGYHIRSDPQAFGNFFFRLETAGAFDGHGFQISSGNELATKAQKSGILSRPFQRDSYTFQANPGQLLNIVTSGAGVYPLGRLMLELYDPEEFLIGATADFPIDGRAVLSMTLPTRSIAGVVLPAQSTYRVVVSALDQAGGPPIPFADEGAAYPRIPARANYELKVFTGAIRPTIVSVTPTSGEAGTPVIIAGRDFAPGAENNVVQFGGIAAVVTSASATEIVTAVPAGVAEGSLEITVEKAGMGSPAAGFVVLAAGSPSPVITGGQATQFAKIDKPGAMAVGPDGTAYVVGLDSGTLFAVSRIGTHRLIIELGAEDGAWRGLATDTAGNVYVSHFTGNEVLRIAANGTKTTFARGITQPTGLTVDWEGNVYVSSHDTGKVVKLTPPADAKAVRPAGTGAAEAAVSEFASGLSQPGALQFNDHGVLFVASRGNNIVSKVPAEGGAAETFVQLDETPEGLAFDARGNLLVGTTTKLKRVAPDGQTSTVGTGFSEVSGLGLDYEGRLLVADAAADTVYALTVKDADGDGLEDGLEYRTCTEPDDADTDDDGIPDGKEDANHNGKVDRDETHPCEADTDKDDIQDGTELGYTLVDIDNAYTDTGFFQPDLDPTTTTDPSNPDTDGDGLKDGGEDTNHNGRFDRGETDPNFYKRITLDSLFLLLFDSKNNAPTAKISKPSGGATYQKGESITFNGNGQDTEDGDLTGASLVWTSSRDGQIGTGTQVTVDSLSVGEHTITLTVNDSKGATGKDSIRITITMTAGRRTFYVAFGELTEATIDIPPGMEIGEELTSDFETEFYTDIFGDIQGTDYRLRLCMRSTKSRTVYADIVLNPWNDERILASTTFSVDNSALQIYEDTISGIDPDIPLGGMLALRLISDTTESEVSFVVTSDCISSIETPPIED
jgi:sugar lactone lactonase YvrE